MEMAGDYRFTQNWFETSKCAEYWPMVDQIIEAKSYLEVGSFEGYSTCWMIENTRVESIICIDTWQGGAEHNSLDMSSVEARFDHNISIAGDKVAREVALMKNQGHSLQRLAELIAQGGSGQFDCIYIDGSHRPADVLADAVLSFDLLRPGGCIIFDDYCWSDVATGDGINSAPKIGIDAFTTCFFNELAFVKVPLGQLMCLKKNREG